MLILGIESSCDETAASLLRVKPSKRGITLKILSNIVWSQTSIHRQYGGIVPEVAARAHIGKILPVIKEALEPLSNLKIDLIAVTNGPGLVTSLLVGVEVAKTLSYARRIPLLPINHLSGHIYANFIDKSPISPSHLQNIFPAICLIVSGGHTELGLMKKPGQYKKIGQTRDDAAGECFDKTAKLLDIGYPGGPIIARYAAKSDRKAEIRNFELPRPMLKSKDFDFSFSGLKTAVLYLVKRQKLSQKIGKEKTKFIRAVCAETQQAIIDVLIAKTIRAARQFKVKSIILGGGVVANSQLRKQLEINVYNLPFQINLLIPPKNLCTDNAAMIAAAGYFKYQNLKTKEINNLTNNWRKIKVKPNLEI